MSDALRLADLLAALSVTTDLAMGQAPEKAIRAAVLASAMARHLELPESDVRDVYYTTLMKHLGCTATTHEESWLFGPDERAMRAVAERTDDANARELLALMAKTGRGAGRARPAYLARALRGGSTATEMIFRSICEVGVRMAARLGLGDEVERALGEMTERWDGKGPVKHLAGEDISLAVRIAEPATQAVIFWRLGGGDALLAMAARRSGGLFDPEAVEALRAVGPAVLERLDRDDPWTAVLDAEPEPVRTIEPGKIGTIAEAFGDMVDLKTTFTLGHSAAVAELAQGAAERLGLEDPETVRIAGLVHDLGRVAVATGVWEKRDALSTREWEQVRLHAYHTERILARAEVLEPVARIAGKHHERIDGSGYHRGASARELPAAARVLAVADAYQAMTQARAHRGARSPEEAADVVTADVAAGRFDPECARAVLEAAGRPATRSKNPRPAGLSEREVEVLRLLSGGLSNRGIAQALVISPRTAEHHVQHIYAKIGASTRAAAAMFAMEHGLLRR